MLTSHLKIDCWCFVKLSTSMSSLCDKKLISLQKKWVAIFKDPQDLNHNSIMWLKIYTNKWFAIFKDPQDFNHNSPYFNDSHRCLHGLLSGWREPCNVSGLLQSRHYGYRDLCNLLSTPWSSVRRAASWVSMLLWRWELRCIRTAKWWGVQL